MPPASDPKGIVVADPDARSTLVTDPSDSSETQTDHRRRPRRSANPGGDRPNDGVGVRIDLGDGSVQEVGHPDLAGRQRSPVGRCRHLSSAPRVLLRVDAGDGARAGVRDPDAGSVHREPDRLVTDLDRRRTSPLAGSMRETESLMLFATHTPPSPTAIAGASRHLDACTTEFFAGLIRETVALPPLATQTDPAPTAIPEGSAPTGIVSTTPIVSGSIWTTAPRSGSVTHNSIADVTPPGRDSSGTDPLAPRFRADERQASPAI